MSRGQSEAGVCLWLAETPLTSLKPLNGICRKLDRNQELKVSYQICIYLADQEKKVAALTSDWLRHFHILLGNCWMEFAETWQETKTLCMSLPSLCFLINFFGQSNQKKKMAAYQFSSFLADGKKKITTLADLSKKAHCTLVIDIWPFRVLIPLMGWEIANYCAFQPLL